jgi:hypothetical protein
MEIFPHGRIVCGIAYNKDDIPKEDDWSEGDEGGQNK